MRSTPSVLRAVQTGAMSLDDLSPDSFEDLIVEIVRTEYGHFSESASITRDRRYDVDIVVRERKRGPFVSDDEMHFIEAKCYGKSLSLDTTAKAYCAALRYRPRSLTIACKSALQPQPLDYGRALFGDGRVTQLYILNLRRALSLEALDPVLEQSPTDVRAPLFRLESWQIWKHTTFTAELIATSEVGPVSVMADDDARYDLIIIVDISKAVSQPKFHLSCQSGNQIPPRDVKSFGDVARIGLQLTSKTFSKCDGTAELVAVEGARLTSESIRLPSFQVEARRLILPDLRQEVSDYWADRLVDSVGPKVLLLRGEGGIGKTYLCERVAASLQQKTGGRCAHIAVDSATSHLTFLRLIFSILFPPDIERSAGLAFEQEAIQSLLKSLDLNVPSTSQTGGNEESAEGLAGVDLHAQITLAAKLVATQSSPVAMFISNCQHLAPELILGLRAFLVALDQFGWSNCRVVCEYRESTTSNTHLKEFVEAVLANRIGKAADLEVKRVSTEAVLRVASTLFPASQSRSVAATLMKKTAGNPFLIENLLQHYRDKGIIARTGSSRYEIVDHARFNAFESEVSQQVQHLLVQRLKHLDSVLEESIGETDLASRILGLAALMGPRIDDRVWRSTALDTNDSDKIQRTFESHAILTRSLDDGSARFSHDLMRAACRERLAEVPAGEQMVESALTRIEGGEPADFELRGTLHAFLRNEREAMNEFNRGYELAAHGNQDFAMQKRCLAGVSGLFDRRHPLDDRDRLMHVEVLSKLGWAEHNSGSSAHAADYYLRALSLVEQADPISEIWSPVVTWERTAALTHALLGLSLPTLKLDSAVKWGQYAIRNAQDLTRLGKILNRLVRLCNLFGYPDAGIQTAELAEALSAYSRDPEVLAVLCTDIGDLYLHAQPLASKKLRERGLTEAKERRQQLHNETCTVISDVYASSRWASEESIARTLSDARSVGVRNVVARLSLYRGAKACAEGALDLARLYFLEAGQISLLSGDRWLETLANNNLAIVAWNNGDDDAMNAEAKRVLRVVDNIVRQMPPERSLVDLVALARTRGESLRSVTPRVDNNSQLPLVDGKLGYCGTLNMLLRNLEELGRLGDSKSASTLWTTRQQTMGLQIAPRQSHEHPLAICHNGLSLVLTVE